MTIDQALKNATKQLTSSSSPALDAILLLTFVLKMAKEKIYAHGDRPITPVQLKKYQNLVRRHRIGEPIAYLLGSKDFFGRAFKVNRYTLIPRPETEELIEELLLQLKNNKERLTIADIGTGSGNIAITLAKELPKAKISATDISKSALKLAEKNAAAHGVKIDFHHGDGIAPLARKKIDIIVANLPYLPDKDNRKTNPAMRSLSYEPATALFAGDDGLDAYRALFDQIKKRKQQPRLIITEIDPRQIDTLPAIINEYLSPAKIEIKKDSSGQHRIVVITNF